MPDLIKTVQQMRGILLCKVRVVEVRPGAEICSARQSVDLAFNEHFARVVILEVLVFRYTSNE